MAFSLVNYKKKISAAILKHGQQLLNAKAVRELDEEKPGNFIAYVDEGKNSFDVSIQFKEKEIEDHSCDCGNEYFFCEHKCAVLLHLIERGSAVAVKKIKPIKKSKVQLELDEQFEGISFDQLKEWLGKKFKESKSLKLVFQQTFKPEQLEISVSEIQQHTVDLARSVIGSRTKVTAKETTQILSLWKTYHESIVSRITANPINQNSFECLRAITIGSSTFYTHYLRSTSQRIVAYYQHVFIYCVQPLLNLTEYNQWLLYFNSLSAQLKNRTTLNINHGIIDWIEINWDSFETSKQDVIVHSIMELYSKKTLELEAQSNKLPQSIFIFLERTGKIDQYLHQFRFVRGERNYNLRLFEALRRTKQNKLIIEFLEEEFRLNNFTHDKLVYVDLLLREYTAIGNYDGILICLKNKFLLRPSLEAYVEIDTAFKTDKEREAWFKVHFDHLHFIRPTTEVTVCVFSSILFYKKEHDILLARMMEQCYWEQLDEFKETLYAHDPKALLRAALSTSCIPIDLYTYAHNKNLAKSLTQWIREKYTDLEIVALLNTRIKPSTYVHYTLRSAMRDDYKKK